MIGEPSTDWMSDGLCRGTDADLWYPVSLGHERRYSTPTLEQIAQAKAVCAECPVREDCLVHAKATGELQGIWGGLLPEERGAPSGGLRRCGGCDVVFVARNRMQRVCGGEECRRKSKNAANRRYRERNL